MERSIRILSEIGGWVLVRSLATMSRLRKGLMMYIGAVAWLADLSWTVEVAIFSSADASPSGYLV